MIHATADIEQGVYVAPDAQIWHYVHLREGVEIGSETVIGRGVYVDHDVHVGARCKIQNYALIYYPAFIGEGVFIGPGVQLLNDSYPRAIYPDGVLKKDGDWLPQGVTIGMGASIGAGSIIMPGVQIGDWALIGAGSIVTHDIGAHGLFQGSPARPQGLACRCLIPGCKGECQ